MLCARRPRPFSLVLRRPCQARLHRPGSSLPCRSPPPTLISPCSASTARTSSWTLLPPVRSRVSRCPSWSSRWSSGSVVLHVLHLSQRSDPTDHCSHSASPAPMWMPRRIRMTMLSMAGHLEGAFFVKRVQDSREQHGLEPLTILGDESFEAGVADQMVVRREDGDDGEKGSDGEEDGEDEGDEEPCVQCDRKSCRREVTDPEARIFTNKFGQDFCQECAQSMGPRDDWREMSVAQRLAEAMDE
mmetsp:Transcript_25355/g.71320  ORF Transcript_25355/g.71320 Transcript_25355/m.71320 type:complete len:244 (+) Transcript_25355:317-1048(+)